MAESLPATEGQRAGTGITPPAPRTDHEAMIGPEPHPDRPGPPPSKLKRWWRWGRAVFAISLLVAGMIAAYNRRIELRHGIDQLGRPQWPWLVAAIGCQASSMVAFARLQRWLLRWGGVRVRLRDMVEITVAGNALSTSVPGGAAWAAGWAWGQLRRRSVDRVLASWVMLVAGALSSFALFLLVVIGTEIADGHGPVGSIRWLTRSLLGLAVLIGLALFAVSKSGWVGRHGKNVRVRLDRRGGWAAKMASALEGMPAKLRVVNPSPWGWIEALLLAMYNWVADLLTMIFVIWTLHDSVPWRGIVVAYSLTQISASIPITPGGLAVVEASLTALLTGYGMPASTAVGVVLLYRIISFWALVPIGWMFWGYLELAPRRKRSGRSHPWAQHLHVRGQSSPYVLRRRAVGGTVGINQAAPPPLATSGPSAGRQPVRASRWRRSGPARFREPDPCIGCDEPIGTGDAPGAPADDSIDTGDRR